MAITRAQQAKQLLAQGGRIGLRGGADAATESFAQSQGQDYADKVGSQFGFSGKDVAGDSGKRTASQVRDDINRRTNQEREEIDRKEKIRQEKLKAAAKRKAKESLSFSDKFKILSLKNQIDQIRGTKPTIGGFMTIGNIFNPSMIESAYRTDDDDEQDYFEGVDFGISGSDLEREQNIKEAITKAEDTGDITQKEFEDAFYSGKNYSLDKDGNIVSTPKTRPTDNTGGGDGIQDPCKGPNPPAYCFIGARGTENIAEKPEEIFTPNLRLLAGGGMADKTVGGEFDFESARQMYGLGKLVKKVTRGIKKIVKSPIGKAAIIGGLTFGIPGVQSGFFSKGLMGTQKGLGFKKFLGDTLFGKVTDLGIYGPSRNARVGGLLNSPLALIGGASALAGLMTKKDEDDEEELYAGADIDDPRTIMANPYNYLNIRNMAEGGSTEKEPVAKKTMPLLDMDGMEKDYREEGGFVPIGRMEKADDVPARLSKNEFVFTADAVRNAGDGDVDKGAEVMYNMMKNLESGGDVSEESQGLEGAREMFQTSKRLEEVL
jgi:hypothetical protein